MFRVAMLLASLGIALLALSATGPARADTVNDMITDRSISAI